MFGKLRGILSGREMRKFAWLLLCVLLMAAFEVVGVASILPFMQMVSEPDIIGRSEWLGALYEWGGFETEQAFLFATGLAALILLAVSNIFTALTVWMQHRLVWGSAHALAMRLLRTYVYQPYEFFLQRNSSEMGKQVLDEVTQLVRSVLLPLTELIARTCVAVAIFALLIVINPGLAFTVFCVLGSVYVLIYFGVRKYLVKIGMIRLEANAMRYKTASEVLTGIKSVKVQGRERYFLDRFAKASRQFTSVEPKRIVIAQTPRYLVELLAFGGILTIVLVLISTNRGLTEIIPLLSLYALAGYRLLPALQRIFKASSELRYFAPVADSIYRDLKVDTRPVAQEANDEEDPNLSFEQGIRVDQVTFTYQNNTEPVLKNITCVIPKNTYVAFVGPTGSGKTTLVDMIMGLLQPQAGRILVDDTPLLTPGTVRAWHRITGYVPQDAVLYDDTVTRNIVFGVSDKDIDAARVQRAAQIANVHDFIVEELPHGYDTIIGERGVRLSGGQRQRIGLARALYHDPQVLVLDEATSALDGLTEEAVLQAIAQLGHEVTIIMIAHRLATVRACDHIYLLDQGCIKAEGTYAELLENSAMFRGMAKLPT